MTPLNAPPEDPFRIVVFYDNAVEGLVIQAALVSMGFVCVIARDVEHAFEIVGRSAIHGLVMGPDATQLYGLDVACVVSSCSPETTTWLTSSSTSLDDLVETVLDARDRLDSFQAPSRMRVAS